MESKEKNYKILKILNLKFIMKLSIIIVSWNVRDLLRNNLKAVFASDLNFDFEVFVVDNHSRDGTPEMIIKEFPQVNLIINNYNAGFAKANNQAIEQAQGEYVLLLNPDMRVINDTLVNMVDWVDNHQDVGIAGCNLINKKVIEQLGGLDERYFIWFEEVDYCRQLKDTKWKLMYTPAAKCIDYVGKSFGQVPRGKTQIYFRDSMLKYFKKWHSWYQYLTLKIFWLLGILISKIKR